MLRQGIKNLIVEEFIYVTKGGFDEALLGIVQDKQIMIDQLMLGDLSIFEMEDVGSRAGAYGEAAALAADDPRVMQLAGLEADLVRLGRLRGGHYDEQQTLGWQIRSVESNVRYHEKQIEKIGQDLARRVDTVGDKFSAKLGELTYSKRKEFGEALLDRIFKFYDDPAVGLVGFGGAVEQKVGARDVRDTACAHGWWLSRNRLASGDRRTHRCTTQIGGREASPWRWGVGVGSIP
jgi:hypothetical protein